MKPKCKCRKKKHICAFNDCNNHVMKGEHINRYLGVCQECFDSSRIWNYISTQEQGKRA